jgi:tRNA threonylcarbamoyladenosine biosynthesis protein TsaB
MNLLAVDSSFSILSIAVSRGDKVFYDQAEAGTKHSEIVMGLLDEVMKKASIKPENIEGVVCAGGPGSFTGLRIGYSIAKGLALSLSIPFAPVPTLDCFAFLHNDVKDKLVLAVIESKKNSWYYAFYKNGKRLTEDKDGEASVITAEINDNIILTGPGAASLFNALPPERQKNITLDEKKYVYARELIAIAKTNNLFDKYDNSPLYSGPEYIRKTDAEQGLGIGDRGSGIGDCCL